MMNLDVNVIVPNASLLFEECTVTTKPDLERISFRIDTDVEHEENNSDGLNYNIVNMEAAL